MSRDWSKVSSKGLNSEHVSGAGMQLFSRDIATIQIQRMDNLSPSCLLTGSSILMKFRKTKNKADEGTVAVNYWMSTMEIN